MAASSELMVELIMLVFFSCKRTIRLSTESSMQRRVMVHGRDCPMRWHRSADCHSAAGFHHLNGSLVRCIQTGIWHDLRINDENVGSLGEIQGDTTSLERHKETLHLHVLHEVVDGSGTLRWSHTAVEHDGGDACATQSPLDELQHGGELGEDDRLMTGLIRPELVEFVDEQLDLGRRNPILHLDPVDDA